MQETENGQPVEPTRSLEAARGGSSEELSAGDILSANDIIEELVLVPEWKTKEGRDTVRVRALTGTERDAFEASIVNARGPNREQNLRNVRAKLVYLSVVKPDGSRLFTESQIPQLGAKSAAALNRVWNVAQRLSGISDEEVKELALGFDDAPSELSTSD